MLEMEGVVKVLPVPRTLCVFAVAYQMQVAPSDAVALSVTAPLPQREAAATVGGVGGVDLAAVLVALPSQPFRLAVTV